MTRKVVTALSILAAVMVALFWVSTYVDAILGEEFFYIGPPDMGVEWINGMWIAELVDGDTRDGFGGSALRGHCVIRHNRSRRPLSLGQPFRFNLGPFAVWREYLDPNDGWSVYRDGDRTRLTREQAQALPTVMAVHQMEFDVWLVFVLVGAYPAARMIWWPLRRRRRRTRGLCPSCGYDLTENTSGVCPECATGVG